MKKLFILMMVLAVMCCASFAMANGAGANSDADAKSLSTSASGFVGDVGSNNTSINAPIPGSVGYGGLINYFGNPTPSANFQPLEQITLYSCYYTEGSLKKILSGSKLEKIKTEFKVANDASATYAYENKDERWIKVVVSTTKYSAANATFIGFVTAKANSMETNMVEVMASAALEALEKGCNVIHFTAQGASRDVFSKGWGIGFASTQAQLYDGVDRSNVSAGGFGISSAQAGTRDKPWLQGFGLVDYDLKFKK